MRFTLNGRARELDVAPSELLVDVLRDRCGTTSVKLSCAVQVCGACTVLLDGLPASSCCTLAVEAGDRTVTTVEGLRDDALAQRIEDAFVAHAAVQCGFCTPGLVLALHAAVAEGHLRSRDDVVEALRGNLCRCTGYRAIIDAACEVVGVGGP